MKNLRLSAVVTMWIVFLFSCTAADKNKSRESSQLPTNSKASTSKKPKKSSATNKSSNEKSSKTISLDHRANEIADYAQKKGLSTKYCFLIDMSLHSGRNRFFVYNMEKQSVVYAGLVAHGSCNERFLDRGRFSNVSNSGCSSLGKYKVGAFYNGSYGASFRLHGLDKSNSNAFSRGVVMHAYDCVPNSEIYPRVLCNSLGCPMVSYNFFDKVAKIIDDSNKPILLWIYR